MTRKMRCVETQLLRRFYDTDGYRRAVFEELQKPREVETTGSVDEKKGHKTLPYGEVTGC